MYGRVARPEPCQEDCGEVNLSIDFKIHCSGPNCSSGGSGEPGNSYYSTGLITATYDENKLIVGSIDLGILEGCGCQPSWTPN